MSHPEQHRPRAAGATIRELRAIIERKQIPLTALSAASGIPRSTLHNKLRGKSDLTVAELVKLAIALEVPAADLLGETDAAARDDPEPRRQR